jgi:plastocyanin
MHRRAFLRATGLTLGAVGIAGCTSQSQAGGNQSPDGTEPQTTTIAMETDGGKYYFDPTGLFVKPGETVTWKIKSGAHSTTAYEKGTGPASVTRIPASATAWNSGIVSEQGATFTHTFDTKGTYDYFCIPHKSLGMVGRIVVGEPGGPAEGSMPPDGTVPKAQLLSNRRPSHTPRSLPNIPLEGSTSGRWVREGRESCCSQRWVGRAGDNEFARGKDPDHDSRFVRPIDEGRMLFGFILSTVKPKRDADRRQIQRGSEISRKDHILDGDIKRGRYWNRHVVQGVDGVDETCPSGCPIRGPDR